MSNKQAMVKAALDYVAQGIPVFPCRIRDEGDKKAKSPYAPSGFKDAACNPDRI